MIVGADEQVELRAGLGNRHDLIFRGIAVAARHTGVRDADDDIRAFIFEFLDILLHDRDLALKVNAGKMRGVLKVRDGRCIRDDDAYFDIFAVNFDGLHTIGTNAVPRLARLIINDIGAKHVLVFANGLAEIIEAEVEFMVAELDGIVTNLIVGSKHRMLTGLPFMGMLHHIGIKRCALQDIAAIDAEDGIIFPLLCARLVNDCADLGEADISRLGLEVIPADDTAMHIRRRKDREVAGKRRTGGKCCCQSREHHDFQRAFCLHFT